MISDINYIELKNCIIDELHVRKNTNNVNLAPTKDVWQIDTYIIASFLGNLNAGNVGLSGLPITNFRIKRRRIDDTNSVTLDTIPRVDGDAHYLDHSARSGISYEYEVIPMSNSIEGLAYSIQVKCEFDYWWLSNIDDGETYPFMANLEVGDIATNTQRYVYSGFNEFPTIAYGEEQYQSGSITAILLDTLFETSFDYRTKVERFINNKKPKYLKSSEGDLWIVDTHTSRRQPQPELSQKNISYLTFEYTEIDEPNE